jgi:5-methylcytosine-specific restriction endonuclease McrA
VRAANNARYAASEDMRRKARERQQARIAQNPALKRQYDKEYRAQHRDRLRKYFREHYQQHREERLSRDRKHRAANRDAHNARARQRRAADPEQFRVSARHRSPRYAKKARARTAAWRQANPERWNRHMRLYKARKRGRAIGRITPELLAAKFEFWGSRCWMCGGDATEMEHVKPLSKGGLHCLANIRPACKPCNSSKSDRWPFHVRGGPNWQGSLREIPISVSTPNSQRNSVAG